MTAVKYLVLFVALLSPLAQAGGWSTADKVMGGVWGGIHAIDCAQTLKIARNPDEYKELNPLLGEHPSKGKVIAFCVLTPIMHVLVADNLSSKGRKIYQGLFIVLKADAVIYNFRIGLH